MAKYLNHIYLGAIAVSSGLLLAACSDELPVSGAARQGESSEVRFQVRTSDGVSVQLSSQAGEDSGIDPRDCFPVGDDFIAGRSRIRVCSVDRNPGSSYRLPDYDRPYADRSNPTRYHEYICQTKKPYEEYSDFVCYDNAIPLKWDDVDERTGEVILNTGNILRTTVGGGYYLFAAMYPLTYERPGNDKSLAVNENQTYETDVAKKYDFYSANLMLNDIRLCYKMFGRDNFREPIRLDFYHSLCMLVVNVEVPLYMAADGLGFTHESIVSNPLAMSLENIGRNYTPQYDPAYDNDDYVEVITDTDELGTIRMFRTPNFSNPANTDYAAGFSPEESYWDRAEDHEANPVPVRWMQFCAIIPPQNLSDANAYIRFRIGGKTYRCGLSGTPAIPLEQTHATTVTLYIPRGDSDPVIIGAKLKEWERKRTPIISLQ